MPARTRPQIPPPRRSGSALPRRLAALLGVLLGVLVVGGPHTACGTPCEHIRADRDQFLARQTGSSDPHILVAVPFALANRILAEHFDPPPPARLSLPGLGAVGRFLDRVTLEVRAVTLRPARRGQLGVRIVVGVRVGRLDAATLTINGEVRPVVDRGRVDRGRVDRGRVDRGRSRLHLVVRPDDLRDVRATLDADARDRLVDAIWRLIPKPARRLLSRRQVGAVASKVTEELTARAWQTLRDGPLAQRDAIATVSVALPSIPIARIDLRSAGDARTGHLEIAVTTTLPVTEGLAPDQPGPRPRADRIAIRLSGAAAAELGNYAIALGAVPNRYDHEGHAVEDGPFEAGLAWGSGPRPLRVLLWKAAAPCISAQLAGAVRVRFDGDAVVLDLRDGVIEDVRGPPTIEIGAWFHNLWADAIHFSVRAAADLRLDVAGARVALRLRSARIVKDLVTIELTVRISP